MSDQGLEPLPNEKEEEDFEEAIFEVLESAPLEDETSEIYAIIDRVFKVMAEDQDSAIRDLESRFPELDVRARLRQEVFERILFMLKHIVSHDGYDTDLS